VVTALAWQHKGLKFKYYQGKIFLQPFFSQAGVKKKQRVVVEATELNQMFFKRF